MVRADGSAFEAEISAATYRTQEGESLTSLLIRDVSKRVEYQQWVVALNDELAQRVRERTARLELMSEDLRSCTHALAHDLRSPIAAILGFGRALHQSLAASGKPQQQHKVSAWWPLRTAGRPHGPPLLTTACGPKGRRRYRASPQRPLTSVSIATLELGR